MEYASRGVGGTALGLGAGALGLEFLRNGVGGIFGNNNCAENTPVSRYELGLENKITEKDAEIAYLKGQNTTDTKLLELYKYFDGKCRNMEKEICDQKVYNATNISTINCIAGQVNQLFALTKLVVPNSSICPGWTTTTNP
jgi:hypothetical protein